MKAAPFDYARPATVTEAVALLSETGDEAKVLAGGQSLIPVLAMRLGRPAMLVDINAVAGLDQLSLTDDTLHVGATVRQRRLEHDPLTSAVPLLRLALPWIGHRELRSRGTVCGSLAHADPAAELPAVAACLNATLEIAAPTGRRRTVSARDFFTAPMTTVLAPGELLLAAHFPVARPGDGFAFAELSRRHGDYALTGVAAHVSHTPSGRVQQAVLAAFAISARPVTRDVTDILISALTPEAPAKALVRALTPAMSALAAELVDTPGDMHASTSYRCRLFTHLAAQELASAHLRAKADPVRSTNGVRSSPGVERTSSAARTPSAPARNCLANQSAVTALTVNGRKVTVTAPPRVTLADALRNNLGLTGTHLGCEHGICGMCTVLVNDQAARACLLFACQLDGAEVLTVEGLGRPGELHPLQQAFGRHHALQCGFCTPGFLLSAYDLLRHQPEVTEGELAAELSGVLCRCTGYRNILSAVAEVARTHPDGVPAPLNCAPRTGALRCRRRGHGRGGDRSRLHGRRRGRGRGRRRGDRNGRDGGGGRGDGRRWGRGDGWRRALGHCHRRGRARRGGHRRRCAGCGRRGGRRRSWLPGRSARRMHRATGQRDAGESAPGHQPHGYRRQGQRPPYTAPWTPPGLTESGPAGRGQYRRGHGGRGIRPGIGPGRHRGDERGTWPHASPHREQRRASQACTHGAVFPNPRRVIEALLLGRHGLDGNIRLI